MKFAKNVKLRQEKFGAVVFDTLREKVYVTNESGSEILALMDEGLSASEIAGRLGRKYVEDSPQVVADIAEFVSGLDAAGLMAASAEEEV